MGKVQNKITGQDSMSFIAKSCGSNPAVKVHRFRFSSRTRIRASCRSGTIEEKQPDSPKALGSKGR